MRFMNWIADWIPATSVLTVVNVALFAFLLWRDWRLRRGFYTLELITAPTALADHALALHLGLLQATVVGIGVGITVAGVIGYRSMKEAAVDKAVEKAIEAAVDEVRIRHGDISGGQQEDTEGEEPSDTSNIDKIREEPGETLC